MRRILTVAAFASACGFGAMSSKVRHTQTLPDGGRREVSAERAGYGVITQQEMARPGREDIDGAQAGMLDRMDPEKFYGLYGFYPQWYYYRHEPYFFRPHYGYGYGGPYGSGDVYTNRRGPYEVDYTLGHDTEIKVVRGRMYGSDASPARGRASAAPAAPSGGIGPRAEPPKKDERPAADRCVSSSQEFSRIREELLDTDRRDAARRDELLKQARQQLTAAMRDCRDEAAVMAQLEAHGRELAEMEKQARKYADEGGRR